MSQHGTRRVWDDCIGIALLLALCGGFRLAAYSQNAGVPAPTHGGTPAVLTSANEIRRLSPEEASRSYPVRIRGVITMDAPAPDFFVQDATAGIYVEGSASPEFHHQLGELVEVEGVTGPGKFAPVIREQRLRVLGPGVLPKAIIVPFSDLANGEQDSQWVQVRGTVRSASIDSRSWRETILAMRIASGGGEFELRVPIAGDDDFLSASSSASFSWVDSEVLIEGVCGSLFNTNRQLTGILFYVPRLSFIKVEAPARDAAVSDLLRFSPQTGTRHRVRVRGVVAYQQLGHALFVESQSKGLRALTQQNTRVRVGDVVDVIGFPAMGESAPVLEDAVFHLLGHGEGPDPVTLDLGKPWEQFDGALVSTGAKLIGQQLQADGLRLLLQRGNVFFEASFPDTAHAGRLYSMPLNSELRLTGICLVRNGGLWRIPQSLRLLLRSPQDVAVVRTSSWWNPYHTAWLLGIAGGILLAVSAWVVVLRKRLRDQMTLLRQKLQRGAVLEERNRIARELHDSLEQELAGITMQLDLAVDCLARAPRLAEQALKTARDMSRHSMIEAHRSVWDLRCRLLEEGDLGYALAQIVEPLAARDMVKVEAKVQGSALRLPRPVEMNLLRIGQEAVANAVKHGQAKEISVELLYTPRSVCLSVRDDGRGFAADQTSPAGHFGILDMRERAHSMGSQLKIESCPGAGTRVAVEVSVN